MKKLDSIRHKRELIFAESFFNHNEWEYEPEFFYLSNGSKYKPDFKDCLRNVYIEIAGTRQAFHNNKGKIARFIKEFPEIRFEIRGPGGNLLHHYHNLVRKLADKIDDTKKVVYDPSKRPPLVGRKIGTVSKLQLNTEEIEAELKRRGKSKSWLAHKTDRSIQVVRYWLNSKSIKGVKLIAQGLG